MRYSVLVLLLVGVGCATAHYPEGIGRALEMGPDAFLEKAVVGSRDDGAYVVATTQIVKPAGAAPPEWP